MGQLRDRMEQDLILKGFRPTTRRNYLLYGRRLAAFYRRSPEELGEADIRGFLLHLVQVDGVAPSTYRQVLAALRFLYTVTLGRAANYSMRLTRLGDPRRLPRHPPPHRLLPLRYFRPPPPVPRPQPFCRRPL